MNCIVADMFKTAYFCHHYKTRENCSANCWQSRHEDGDVTQNRIPNVGLQEIPHGQFTARLFSSDCRGRDMSLRPPSAVSVSSSSDSAAEVSCSVGDGLGSISSITESVNSWSFRYPEVASVASVADGAADEKSTLLIDTRCRQSPNIATSADMKRSCPLQSVHSQVCLVQCSLTVLGQVSQKFCQIQICQKWPMLELEPKSSV